MQDCLEGVDTKIGTLGGGHDRQHDLDDAADTGTEVCVAAGMLCHTTWGRDGTTEASCATDWTADYYAYCY